MLEYIGRYLLEQPETCYPISFYEIIPLDMKELDARKSLIRLKIVYFIYIYIYIYYISFLYLFSVYLSSTPLCLFTMKEI